MVKIHNTLFFRLFIILLGVMLILFGSYAYYTIKMQEEHLMAYVNMSVNMVSDFIKGSTRYGMLLNRRDDTHQIILRLGKEPGIEFIRILNKKGDIMFSNIDSEIGNSVDMTAEACYVCHSHKKPIESLPYANRTRLVVRPDGHRSIGLINPIKNEPDCSNADCHAHPVSITVLGVLDIKMSLDQVDKHIREAQNQVVIFSIVMIILISVVSAVFISRVVHKPVKKLIQGTSEIANGNLDHQISIKSKTEIGSLAEEFNLMTKKLKSANQEITEWSESLEKKVQEKTQELNRAHAHLLQIEKMASLGQLSATVAHELNNPLEGILTYIKLQSKRLRENNLSKENIENILHDLNFVVEETMRCGNIVKNMLLFSKQQTFEFKDENIEHIIEKSILLVAHHLQMSDISLVRNYKAVNNSVMCSAPHLQQAVVALLINAIEVIARGGAITIQTRDIDEDKIQIDILDTGQGMSEEVMAHIFEPFFTTKSDGKGVGLGLSVVYGIIEAHRGKINVESEIGKGTCFHIVIPRKNNK